ncbi:MAG: TonB-dependent receptor plug domain-containing protein [Gemmatimonadetes bacterium]|nr:carboxypeptidase regulatory-like domain-containing protein [Gemmatimonadota bacterium]MYA43939.1 TonB-dependent receptor plug domain-containing protein [Gemmatimonadota bacterium]MYE94067.1 TonB-dependent receptor plug domain-containing protein [Gemmatimonadota bacterium]
MYGSLIWMYGLGGMLLGGGGELAAQEEPPRISGRVVDRDTGAGVEGAEIVLAALREEAADSARVERITDGVGLFQFERAGPGVYALTVTHLAYGTFQEQLTLAGGERLALRVTLSPTAIALDPVVVEVASRDQRSARALGTARRRVTSEQLAPIARTGNHLANALAQLVPGVRVRSGRSQPGELVCLEFRGVVSFAQPGCLTPIVIVDNVRQSNGLVTLNTLPLDEIQSVEAVPPGEAGVRYGADSNAGVILIETRSGTVLEGGTGNAPAGLYNWALESRPYPWGKTLAAAGAANAVGLLAGYALSDRCLNFESLAQHFYEAECAFLVNAGSRLALYGAPQVGVGYVVARVGGTDLSRGSMWRNAVANAIVSAPGVVLALTTEEDGFSGSRGLGIVMATVGAPAAAVLADRLFRRVRSR